MPKSKPPERSTFRFTFTEPVKRNLAWRYNHDKAMSYIPNIGDRVEIFDNGWRTTHITPRWAYRYKGEVIRLNDLSVTIRLDDFEGMKIRVDYDDVKPEYMTDSEAWKRAIE